jgi:hypothetical protein
MARYSVMRAHQVSLTIPHDRIVTLPPGVPPGPALVLIVSDVPGDEDPPRKLGADAALGLLEPHAGAFGDRSARELLEEALAEKLR